MEDMKMDLVIFQDAGQPVEVRLDAPRDTVWLTQRQMSASFDATPEDIVNAPEKYRLAAGAGNYRGSLSSSNRGQTLRPAKTYCTTKLKKSLLREAFTGQL